MVHDSGVQIFQLIMVHDSATAQRSACYCEMSDQKLLLS